ncbi:putative Late nodulin [Medicago truncatula]|uniref:Putative Late nodulin n=1 Tax=Medicago truncatula TaxID=3880 RepID=A0A396I355_MEDTR|nr:putative Late nodulin [Medicago truncatula]
MVAVTKLINVMLIFLTLFLGALSIFPEHNECRTSFDCRKYFCQLPLRPTCNYVEIFRHYYDTTCGCA